MKAKTKVKIERLKADKKRLKKENKKLREAILVEVKRVTGPWRALIRSLTANAGNG